MTRALLLLLPLSGCSAEWKGGDTGITLGDTSGDTGESAADSVGDSAETATYPTLYNWVLATMPLSGRTAGFDWDGDSTPDNALSDYAAFVDVAVAAALGAAGPPQVLQLAGLDPTADPSDWDDESVAVALLTATDTDGDPADNASGTELFSSGGAVDDSGAALDSQATSIVSGGYTAAFSVPQLRAGTLTLDLSTPLRIAAYADPETNGGTMGFGFPLEAARALAEAGGAAENVIGSMDRAADLDLDGDGTREAISAAFQYTAVACQLE